MVALVLEPIVFLAADRWPRRWFLRGGLVAMAASAFACALAPGPVTLALSLSLGFVASGTATTLAQATLVDRHPDARERVMTRWMLLGEVGDLIGPILLAGLAAAGLGWRAGFAVVGALVAAWCVLVWSVELSRPGCLGQRARATASARNGAAPRPPPTGGDPGANNNDMADDDDEPDEPVLPAIKTALREGGLLRWLAAAALCDLLDEIVVVFASFHLRDDLGAGPTERAVVLTAFMVGGVVGALATDRLLTRHPPLRVLRGAALACAITYAAWLAAPTWWLSAIGMAAVGATTAPLYPICQAQCYAALPGRSGAVNAAGHLFTPLAMVTPWLLGLLADHAGVMAALIVLLAQPLGILALTTSSRRCRARPRTRDQPGSR